MTPLGRPRDERGVAVVVALGLLAVLVFVAAVSAGTVGVVVTHRRAQAAADLAALAGAAALQRGEDPCLAATRIARRHDARLGHCLVEGQTLAVTTTVALPSVLGGRLVPARARAGPMLITSTGPGEPTCTARRAKVAEPRHRVHSPVEVSCSAQSPKRSTYATTRFISAVAPATSGTAVDGSSASS